MGIKKRPRGLPFRATRYLDFDEQWKVALYPANINPDDCPHDWEFQFNAADWRRMGGKMPPKSTMHKGWVDVILFIGGSNGR